MEKKDRKRDKRVSYDPNSQLGLAPSSDKLFVKMPFDEQIFELITNYSVLFPDFAQAVGNLQFTPNARPRVDLIFSKSTSDAEKEKTSALMGKLVSSFWTRVYPSGVSGFVVDSVGQIARHGASSIEWVLDKNYSRVNKAVFVPVAGIRFKTKKDGSFYPVQKISGGMLATVATSPNAGINLDIPTYVYTPLETIEGNPHGIPPFISVLEKLGIQANIMEHLGAITKKLGLLGFLKLLMERPEQKPGESEEMYTRRLQDTIDTWAAKLTKNLNKGMVVGYQDMMEMDHQAIAGDARGVTQIMQVVEEQVISGFKSDPAMFGRTYSTTETYAGVVYDKFINMLDHYLEIIGSTMETGLKLEMQFQGIAVDDIKVIFDPPKSLTALADAQTEQARTDTVLKKRNSGIIDQTQAAREMKYDRSAYSVPQYDSEGKNLADMAEIAKGKNDKSPQGAEPKDKKKKESKNSSFTVSLTYDKYERKYTHSKR